MPAVPDGPPAVPPAPATPPPARPAAFSSPAEATAAPGASAARPAGPPPPPADAPQGAPGTEQGAHGATGAAPMPPYDAPAAGGAYGGVPDAQGAQGAPYAATGAGGAGVYGGGPGDPYGAHGDPYAPYAPYAMSPGQPVVGDKPRRRGSGLVAAVIVAALVAGGVGGGLGYWAAQRSDNGSTTVSSSVSPKDLNRAPTSVAGIANKALPSVVTIQASGSQESGTGTGFVYDTQGHILTNNHVVAPAANGGRLTATFSDGRKFDAEVVGRAQGYDVAVIKLRDPSGAKLTPLPIGNSDDVAVGDPAIAIGAPFGLSGTVTTGIISAKNRPVASSDGQGSSASYMSALQTDASINPGNSGGPLLNAGGAVVGINSAIQSANNGGGSPFGGSSQAGSIGLGFAIPINEAKYVADTLIKTGRPVYAVMKMSVDMNYSGQGAKISSNSVDGGTGITPGGPADKAGLKPGDVITKLDDTVIDSGPTLIGTIWQHRPGDQVKITYQRDGRTATTTVTLGERTGDS
nr:trypsin-like peptidase domain-containing protein [Streptomyces sp. SID5468]